MAGAFSAGVEADPDAEDPAMMRFVEDELAKKRRAAEGGGAVDAADRAARDSNPSAAERNDGGGLGRRPRTWRASAPTSRRRRVRMMTRHRRSAASDGARFGTSRRPRAREANDARGAGESPAQGWRRAGLGLDGPAERFGERTRRRLRFAARLRAASFGKGGGAREGWGSRAREGRREGRRGGSRTISKSEGRRSARSAGGRGRWRRTTSAFRSDEQREEKDEAVSQWCGEMSTSTCPPVSKR